MSRRKKRCATSGGGVTKRGEADRILLADVGGTNVRFAVLRDGKLGPVAYMAVTEHQQFADAVAAFIGGQADTPSIRYALFGAAGLVEGGRCALTNNDWVVDAAELAARFGFAGVHIVNDFEAVAWSLPLIAADDVRMIGGGAPKPGAPMVVLGPGTGLGVAAYIPGKGDGSVMRGEGGHVTMPSNNAREDAIIGALRQKLGHVSAERVVSGSGLENIYWAIAALEHQAVPERNAAAITQAAVAGTCAISSAALDTFCALLGEFAGNCALTFDAQGGVFIAGGIAPRLRDYLPQSQFRSRFEAKGRMSRHLAAMPVYLIVHEDPALIGLQRLAQKRLQDS
jgi:glucokinase